MNPNMFRDFPWAGAAPLWKRIYWNAEEWLAAAWADSRVSRVLLTVMFFSHAISTVAWMVAHIVRWAL